MDKELLENASPGEREFYQTKVRQANEAILNEIRTALNKLFKITAFPLAYKDFPGDIDYKTFVEKLSSAMQQKAPHGHLWLIKDLDVEKSLSSKIKDNKPSSEHPDFILTGYLFLSPQYKPPEEVTDIMLHLVSLYLWYKSNADIQSYFFATPLALAFGKLLMAVGKLETISIMKVERELTRTKRSNKAKKDKSNKRKDFVVAIYEHGEDIKTGTKLNKACNTIIKQFDAWRGMKGPWGIIPKDPEDMKTPSLDSITRWLNGAGIRDRDFNLEGKSWVKHT